MKYRIIAFFILIFFVGLPAFFYWFFTTKQVSGLDISVSEGASFSVHLQGKLSYSLLPLADKVLDFKKECMSTCILSPIPPVDYSVILSSSGMADINQSIHLTVGETKTLKYQFTPNITLVRDIRDDTPLGESFSGISLLKQLSKSRFLGVSYISGEVQFGVVSDGIMTPLKVFSDTNLQVRLDMNPKYILIGNPLDAFSEIYDTEGTLLTHIPFSQDGILSVSVLGDEWKIKTKNSIYTSTDGILTENPRFTDFVDISSQYRVGYIDKNDKKRINLSNLTDDSSFLVLLDRYSGNATYKKIIESLKTCFLEENNPVCIGSDGNRFLLKIGK